MTTTAQQIIDRAKSKSILNPELAGDTQEMLTEIRGIQQRAFVACAKLSRARFGVSGSVNSTNAGSGREADVAAFAPPILRLLQVKITSSGAELNQVPEVDQNAKRSPRYFVRGQKLIEVGSDWGASGVVGLTVLYTQGPTAITVTGATSQNVTVPDEHIGILVNPLAMHLHNKDAGRDPSEHQRLADDYKLEWEAWLDYLTSYGGDVSRHYERPVPPELGREGR